MFGQFLYLAKFLPSLTAFFAIMYIFIVVNGQILNKIITHLATLVKCVTRQVYQTIVVVAQLVERSFPIPEVCGLNPDIGKYLYILNIC